MRLLLDENLAPSLVGRLEDLASVIHVRECRLASASDTEIWRYARTHDCILVSKDSDFHQRSLLTGAPPKLIWIRRGNCTTSELVDILRRAMPEIQRFADDARESLLVIDGQ